MPILFWMKASLNTVINVFALLITRSVKRDKLKMNQNFVEQILNA